MGRKVEKRRIGMEFNSYEYSAEQVNEGKWKIYRALLIIFYISFASAYFLAIYISGIFTLGAFIPVALWILIFFTWRFVKPDYKYTVESGIMTFIITYGGKTKREVVKLHVKDAYLIGRVEKNLSKIEGFAPKKKYSAIPFASCPDVYAVLFYEKNGTPSVLYFRATAQALKVLSFYNREATEITSTEL